MRFLYAHQSDTFWRHNLLYERGRTPSGDNQKKEIRGGGGSNSLVVEKMVVKIPGLRGSFEGLGRGAGLGQGQLALKKLVLGIIIIMAGVGRRQEIFRNGDASDAYANRKALYLSFFHLASKLEINFKAFVTSYGENFSSDYNFENVFGRNDPIATFKQTTRRINISWSIPAASLEEAKTNLARCNRLAQFMYPAYTSTGATPFQSRLL